MHLKVFISDSRYKTRNIYWMAFKVAMVKLVCVVCLEADHFLLLGGVRFVLLQI